MSKIYPSPKELILDVSKSFLGPKAKKIESPVWQGIKNETPMIEVFDNYFRVMIPQTHDKLLKDCEPDLPWAPDHFDERVSRLATNPGNTFHYWPYYREDSYRNGIFSHTYQERFWPNSAKKEGSKIHSFNGDSILLIENEDLQGIRFPYGDLDDVVEHLYKNPNSRQAYFPIWFPEDTGVIHGGRVPCSIGYLFSYRDGYLHMSYDLRSCDLIRHFKNDVYFACRLGAWFLNELKKKPKINLDWSKVQLGILSFHITSFHIFESDLMELKKRITNLNK